MAGSAGLVLVEGVRHLDPEGAVFEAMLGGWTAQQRARFLKDTTIGSRLRLVQRFAEFTGQYPWQWSSGEAEAFFVHLRSPVNGRPLAVSAARGYQRDLRLFLDYVCDARYSWPMICNERFGDTPVQIFHKDNSLVHVSDYEGDPRRRPLTYDEVQALFDAADARVEDARVRGRKGALSALRDSALIKTVYAFGLRRREAWGLDLSDFRHNPRVAGFGRFGGVFVRWGKASRGSPPRRRTVLTVPEMDWIVEVLQHWCDEARPVFDVGKHPACWVTERRGRMSLRSVNQAFETARVLAGLPEELDLHCLRHSYITHLVEFGYPEKFVQDQAGHTTASTTAIYTGVSDEFRNRLLEKAIRQRHAELWEDTP